MLPNPVFSIFVDFIAFLVLFSPLYFVLYFIYLCISVNLFCTYFSVILPSSLFLYPHIFQVNIMVLTRVVVITISTAKRRSIMLAMGTSPVEQAYEQMRYEPQGGAISPPFWDYSPRQQALEQTSCSHCMSNKKAARKFYIGFMIFKTASLIYQTR